MRPENFKTPDNQIETIQAFVHDSAAEGQLKSCFEAFDLTNYQIMQGGLEDAIRVFREEPSPSLLIVDISHSDMPLSGMEELAKVCAPYVKVLAIGVEDKVGLYRNLIMRGVSEYLVTPLPQELLQATISKIALGSPASASDPKAGKVLGVFHASGGAGATTIACSLSHVLSAEFGRRIMLLDLDVGSGGASLLFGLNGNKGAADLFKHPERMDDLLVQRAAQQINPRLEFLGSSEVTVNSSNFSEEEYAALLGVLKPKYHYVILDVPYHLAQTGLTPVRLCDHGLFIVEPSIQSIRNTKKIMDYCSNDLGHPFQMTVILNHSRPLKKSGPALDQIEAYLERQIDHIIPFDAASVGQAELNAVPPSQIKGKFSHQVMLLAGRLSGQELKNEKHSVFSFFKGRQGMHVRKKK
ncbi:AAA family ATPase [Sneathiella aquimaris]|uniref:AAA family ATPase n=1 Tax=Sneathiella aquimaris TaxID=2599305 RepID=UPI00146CDE18|nr:AAA family ATPase [Sneathiella aquimaris]